MSLDIQRCYSSIVIFLLVLIHCLLITSESYPEDSIEVIALNAQLAQDSIKVIIKLSNSAQYTHGRLTNPERLFVDIKSAKISKRFKNECINSPGFLKGVRIAQFNSNTVRVVFDLEDDNYKFKLTTLDAPARIIVDLYSKSHSERTNKMIHQKEELIKRRLVIDPGHGGHDPGAVGQNGLYEKDVVLDIALKVREIFHKEHPNYEVILTRDGDFFIPLDKRADIANRANADLFISIHANASYNRAAYGIETYILNWTDDEEAMRVAARENAISLNEMKRLRDELSIILASLESELKRDESIKLAGFIHRSMVSKMSHDFPDFDRGVKQALFYVLVGAKMPSVLLEIGFISNHYEEKLLRNEGYRMNIAKSIVHGILNYFSETPVNRTIVYDVSHRNQKVKAVPLKYSKLKR